MDIRVDGGTRWHEQLNSTDKCANVERKQAILERERLSSSRVDLPRAVQP